MTLIRFILFLLLFYVVIKVAKYLIKIFTTPVQAGNKREVFNKQAKSLNIDKEDIIEADFEDIKDPTSKS
ncbi:MAG: hypothetical protein A2V66_08585 [Ignavibacteria bacterium RBG_13_36_8]|nr:MAG: hypothetical protein A2V66_08585 [Ignavibacteria bacterium RBG_13_36_8]